MSWELLSDWPQYLVPLMVLLMSLLGSAHCMGMCGPLSLMVGQNRYGQFSYHVGRLLGYLIIGVLAGLLGSYVLADVSPILTILGSLVLAASFFWLALSLYRGHLMPLPLPKWFKSQKNSLWSRWVNRVKNKPYAALVMGVLSPFLPCGWLYAFVVTAVISQSVLWGGILLCVFWLGTLPALIFLPKISKKPLSQWGVGSRRLLATLFLLLGSAMVYSKLMTLSEPVPCQQGTQQEASVPCPLCH